MIHVVTRASSRSKSAIGMIAVVFFIFLMPLTGEAESGPTERREIDYQGHPAIDRIIPSKANDLFVVLKNGLTVLIRESHGAQVVSCQVHVKTGSIFEGDRMGGGLSHYLEHVVSGGTTSRFSEAQISKHLQTLGGASNAYTSYGETTYFINTTGPLYRDALELLWAYVTDCQFEEREYEREKKVIVQEIQMGENDPSRQLWHAFLQAAYRRHPVRTPIIGDRDVFLSMDRQDLMAHYERWYTPEYMVISVAGNVKKEMVLADILEIGGGTLKRAKTPPYVLPKEPRQLASRKTQKMMPVAKLTQAMLGFRTVSLSHPDLYPLDVLAVIMGDGRTSRLYRTVRDQKRLVLSVGAWNWTPDFAEGQFVITMDLSQEKLNEAVAAVRNELETLKEIPVSEAELQRAKNKVIADYVFGLETAQSQAAEMASNWMSTGDPYFSEHYVENIRKVRAEDITHAVKKYFDDHTMTLAVVTPPQEGHTADKKEGPSIEADAIGKRILPNQLTLLTRKNTASPIVTFQFFIKGGSRFEPPDKPGLCHFMAELLTKGTETRSKLEIATALEDVGGSIGTTSGRNTMGVSVSVLKEHVDLALDVLADVLLRPTFPEDEIEKQRQDTLLAIKRLDEDWTSEISRMFRRHYFRDHPYRNDVIGKKEAVETFSRKDLQALYKSIVISNNAVLSVFGDIDPAVVAAKVTEVFGGMSPGLLEQPIIPLETENIKENETFVVHNEKTSAAIMVGFNGLTLYDADSPVVDVLDAIISGIGYPSGWLHEALRGGNQSLVYFIHAFPAFGIDGGYFGVMTQTTSQNFDNVLKIILEKIDLIQKEEVDPETLERAKQMCMTMHRLGAETIEAQASRAALHEIVGLGYDWDVSYLEKVERVSAADVLRVANRLFAKHLVAATKPSQKDRKDVPKDRNE